LTPIILLNEYPQTFGRRKFKYTSGLFKARQEVPSSVYALEGGVVIDMPETGCEEYLKSVIDLSKLPSDEVLIENLEHLIEDHKLQRRLKRIR